MAMGSKLPGDRPVPAVPAHSASVSHLRSLPKRSIGSFANVVDGAEQSEV